jgi:hypothetical protein
MFVGGQMTHPFISFKNLVLSSVVCAFAVSPGWAQPRRAFQGIDLNNDGIVTRAEWDRSFRMWDRDRDGVLSADELRAGWREAVRQEDAEFQALDRNSDGWVTRNEWRGSRNSFERVDRNNDGAISPQEYQANEVGSRADVRDTRAYQAAYQRGLQDGRQAGREDASRHNWDLDGQRELEHADAGYSPAVGDHADYQEGYRAGFIQGYGQGFGPRR